MTEIATSNRPVPQVTDRATWQARIDELRVKEKAHTRARDALSRTVSDAARSTQILRNSRAMVRSRVGLDPPSRHGA
jgi:hypothetical protein